jgi:hypothetical protein
VNHAFFECKKLKEITIPDSVTKIGVYAFNDCFALETLTVSESLEEIGDRTFDGCMALQTLEIPVSVKKLGVAVLAGSGIKTLRYEGTVAQWNEMEKNEINDVVSSDKRFEKVLI